MDVVKIVAIVSFFALAACSQQKSVTEVFPEQNTAQSTNCTETRKNNQFIVQWEDGHMSVETDTDAESFSKNFIELKIHKIKHVEFDKIISIRNSFKLEETEIQSLAVQDISDDWGANRISADAVWSQGIDGSDVIVAVIDGAVDYDHTQIIPRLAKNSAEANGEAGVDDDGNGYPDDIYGWDFENKGSPKPTPNPKPYDDHGTHVAGIILADAIQNGRMHGVAPKARLVPIKFLNDEGLGNLSDAIKGIDYAISRGAKIINASWGGASCSDAFKNAIAALETKNILFVAASGNGDKYGVGIDYDRDPTSYTYPAVFNFSNQITVAATSFTDYMTGFSNRSYSLVHIGAPGVDIVSTVSGGFIKMTGTSMAAPFVSGAAALLWSAKPKATAQQIKTALLNSAEVIAGKELKVSSRGRLNVEKALDEIRRLVP